MLTLNDINDRLNKPVQAFLTNYGKTFALEISVDQKNYPGGNMFIEKRLTMPIGDPSRGRTTFKSQFL